MNHQGCVSNMPDEKNQKRKKIITYKNKKIAKSNKPKKNYIKHSGRPTKKTLSIGTWNVRTLNSRINKEFKLKKLLMDMDRFKLDILGISETHFTNETDEAFEQSNYVIIQSSRKDNIRRQGVAIILKKELSESIIDYEIISERIMHVTLDMEDGPWTFFQIYAPDTSYSDVDIEMFYENLQDKLNAIPKKHKKMILGDFNAKIGTEAYKNWEEVCGKFSIGDINESGEKLLQFCALNKLCVTNTLYKHKHQRLVTWRSPDNRTQNQIDFIIIQQSCKSIVKNCRVYNSADIDSDHSLLISTCVFMVKKIKRSKPTSKKFNVEKLEDRNVSQELEHRIGGAFEPLLSLETTMDDLYEQFKNETNMITQEVLGRKRPRLLEGMEPEIEELCSKRRKARLRIVNKTTSQSDVKEYRNLNKQVKKAVKRIKEENLEKKVLKLEDDFKKNNSRNLFRTVRELEGKPKKALALAKDKKGNLHSQINKVLQCWEEHFKIHLNSTFQHDPAAINDIPDPPNNFSEEPPITRDEIREAVRSMKNGKSAGIDEITTEVIKAAGEPMIAMLDKISTKVWNEEKSPKDWSRMLVAPIHKKGDKRDPANYRAIALLSIPGKIFLRVLLNRMKYKIEEKIKETQYGFRPGRGTVDAIFIVRQIMEKAKERRISLHFNFIDFKAAFDTIWRKALWKMLRSIGVGKKIVNIIEQLYDETECAVIINGHLTDWFEVKVGVRQGCLLSPVLFNLFLEFVMNEISSLQNELQLNHDMTIDTKYADDTTLISAIFEKLKIATGELETSCKKWGMKVNPDKCKIISPDIGDIHIDGSIVGKVEKFTFLGSVVPESSSDVKRRIGLASSAFGRLKEKIWSRKDISMKLKIRLYNALIIPIATYASETWTILRDDERRLNVFEMRCLRSILGITLRDHIRNDDIKQELNIEKNIIDIIRTKRMKWFGHVCRLPSSSYVKTAFKKDFVGKRPRGRPPNRWCDQLKIDTGLPLLTAERLCNNRWKWRDIIMKNVARLSGVCR